MIYFGKCNTFTEVRYSYSSVTRYGSNHNIAILAAASPNLHLSNHNIAILAAPSPHLGRMDPPVCEK